MKALSFILLPLFGTILLLHSAIFADAMGGGMFSSPFQQALVSHSGPWDDNNDNNHQDEASVADEKRDKRAIYSWNWGYTSGALIASIPPDYYLRTWITSEHNRYRRMVPATDMRMVYWSDELAASAQRHADTCDFRHSRFRVNIGENIWAAPYHNYSDAIWRWYNEVNNPWCACNNGFKHCCGHYIQLVWSQTNLVGCGYAQCNSVTGVGSFGKAVFVCHYNPQGNKVYVSGGQLIPRAAFTWAHDDSQRCKDCPPDQPACYQGLCYMPTDYRSSYSSQQYYYSKYNTTRTDQQSLDKNEIIRK